MAGVKYQAFYNVTTIDPPDVIYFIREFHGSVKFIKPKRPLLTALPFRGAPRDDMPWCCDGYKESYHPQGVMITGIRAEESNKRADRREFEENYRHTGRWYLNPIIGWASDEIWNYIRNNGIPYCKLYDMGWKRIGCLFCPNATPREKAMHARHYPGYERAFRRAFRALYARRKEQGRDSVDRWASGDEMFEWWILG